MPNDERYGAFEGFLVLTAIGVAALLGTGWAKESHSYDSRGWYAAGGALLLFAVLMWLLRHYVIPFGRGLDAGPGSVSRARPRRRGRKDSGPLLITGATYGAIGYQWADVSAPIRARVSGNGLDLHVENAVLGVDPVPNILKVLIINYRVGNADPQRAIYDEHERAVLP